MFADRSAWRFPCDLADSACAALLLAAATSHAAGVDLSWDMCYVDGPPVFTKAFACDRNTGSDAVVVSFVPARSFASAGLIEFQLDMQTRSGVTLPVWWDFANSTSCRRNQLVLDGTAPAPVLACRPTYATNAPAFIFTRLDFRLPTSDHLVVVASAAASGVPMVAGQEYFACRVQLNHSASVGAGACGGCDEPVAIVLTALRVGNSLNPDILTAPAHSNVVYWQTVPTATRNATWSAVKALYH